MKQILILVETTTVKRHFWGLENEVEDRDSEPSDLVEGGKFAISGQSPKERGETSLKAARSKTDNLGVGLVLCRQANLCPR